MQPNGAVLEARAVNAWRGDRHILRDVSFVLRAGEFMKITGPNGVGKTTLIRLVVGLLPGESGSVLWNGAPVGKVRDDFNTALGYLGHPNSLKADLSGRENLKFLAGLRQSLNATDIDDALDRVGILSRGDIPARSLSAGQKRRLALARLLLAEADLWVMDEPATNLDAAGVNLVEDLIREHVAKGGLVLAAAHQRLLDDASILRRLELN
jgi:heme exporter protein A